VVDTKTIENIGVIKCQTPTKEYKWAKCEFQIDKPTISIPPIINIDKIAWIDFPSSSITSIVMDKNEFMVTPYGRKVVFSCEVDNRIDDQKIISCYNYKMECVDKNEKNIEKESLEAMVDKLQKERDGLKEKVDTFQRFMR